MSSRPSLARVKAPAIAVVCLVVGIALADLLATVPFGWDTARVEPQERQSYRRLELASSKAVALASAARHGRRVALAYGMSTAEQGLQPRALEKLDPSLSWAKITGEYPSFVNLLELARRVEAEHVAPVRTLLCIHYGMLVGARRFPVHFRDRLSRVFSRSDELSVPGEVKRALTLSWLGQNREAIVNQLEARLGQARESLLEWAGQRSEAIYPDAVDPFQDVANTSRARHYSAWQRRLQLIKERGWGEAASYSAGSEQGRALTELIRMLGGRGLVIVLLPEQSLLRELIPEPAAARALRAAIDAAGLASPPPVIDLRAALPDSEFVDEAHPAGPGSARLAATLNAALLATPGAWR